MSPHSAALRLRYAVITTMLHDYAFASSSSIFRYYFDVTPPPDYVTGYFLFDAINIETTSS